MKQKTFLFLLLFTITSPSSVFAAISVNWNTPGNQPIFSVSNIAPGQSFTHTINIQNTDPISQNLFLKGSSTSDSGLLSQALILTISQNSQNIYGPKNLNQFFSSGAPLSQIKSHAQTSYTLSILFDPQAGNIYQNKSLSFNLDLGTTTSTPSRCAGIKNPQILRDCIEDNVHYRYYLFIEELNRRLAQLLHHLPH